ncbi:MAG: hypothetical protein ACOYOU_04660 [Kiritimatiellia bacterium]
MKMILLVVLVGVAGVALCLWHVRHFKAQPANQPFEVAMVTMSGSAWIGIKYHTETGESWSSWNGKWVKIEDSAKLPKGRYVIRMTPLANDWAAVRLEVLSGKSWQCLQGKWVELTPATP